MARKPPELTFQKHIADFLVREHKYGVLEQSEITDTEHFIAEDQLWAFLKDPTGHDEEAGGRLRHGRARRGLQGTAQGTGAHASVAADPSGA